MKKSFDLHIRVTEKEKKEILDCAKKEGLTISSYLLNLHKIYYLCKDMEVFISNDN